MNINAQLIVDGGTEIKKIGAKNEGRKTKSALDCDNIANRGVGNQKAYRIKTEVKKHEKNMLKVAPTFGNTLIKDFIGETTKINF